MPWDKQTCQSPARLKGATVAPPAQAGKQFQFALFHIVADLAAMADAPRLRVPAAAGRACCEAA